MDVNKLWEYSFYMRSNGFTVADEEIAILTNTLIQLQNDGQFKHMYFWGKIYGTDMDYYIAFGIQEDAIKDRKYFYSNDMMKWNLLPSGKAKHKKLAAITIEPFSGIVSNKIKVIDEALEDNDKERCKQLKEEARLIAVVETISDEAAVKARGEIIKQPDGTALVNESFYGLSYDEATKMKTYQHYRTPQFKWNTNLLTRKDYNYSLDIMDTVDTDIPKGTWSLYIDKLTEVVYLKNLYWSGMSYFHKIQSRDAGFVYFGDGLKCLDVPFFLS